LQPVDNASIVIKAIVSIVACPVLAVDKVQRKVVGQEERRGRRILISIRTCNPLNIFDRLP
jgi:hypothetical protein